MFTSYVPYNENKHIYIRKKNCLLYNTYLMNNARKFWRNNTLVENKIIRKNLCVLMQLCIIILHLFSSCSLYPAITVPTRRYRSIIAIIARFTGCVCRHLWFRLRWDNYIKYTREARGVIHRVWFSSQSIYFSLFGGKRGLRCLLSAPANFRGDDAVVSVSYRYKEFILRQLYSVSLIDW